MLIEVRGLKIAYEGTEMVHGVDFTLKDGEVLTIVGESGSGKTTVIRAMLGCLPHVGRVTAGEILYDGKDMTKCSAEDWRHVSGKTAAMIFQDSGSMMDPIRTIGEQFVEYIQTHDDMGAKEAAAQAQDMLARMHLSNPANVMKCHPFELSGGMRQRVGVAMAMFFKPALLLADEPTSALDVTTQAQVVNEMMDICQKDGTSIVLVTHNLGVAAYMSDQIMVMQNGSVVEHGTAEEVIEHPQKDYTKELMSSVPQIGGERYDSIGA